MHFDSQLSVCTTYIRIDFGMANGKRTLAVQKHAAVSRALILFFFNTLFVSVSGVFVTSLKTGKM